jgi:hypothetical protein
MTAQPINLHSFPGRGDIASDVYEHRAMPAERLRQHAGTVLVAAAERYVVSERWGLGIALTFISSSVTGVALVVADDLEARTPEVLAGITAWAASRSVDTPAGPMPVKVLTRGQLCDPDTGVLTTTCYTGGGWLLTADEGRSLGLLADYWEAARGKRFAGGFMLGLPGWGEHEDRTDKGGSRHRGWRSKLHRPTLRAKAIGGHGLVAEFNKAGRGGWAPDGFRAGHWERDRNGRMLPFLGRIVDLIGPAFAFDGLDTSDLSEHLAAFDLPALNVPAAVLVDTASADGLLAVALSAHRVAVVLDAEAARWLTTRSEQSTGRAVVGLRFMASPGSLAGAAWRRSGVTPPLRKFGEPADASLDRWAAAGHGGWTT